MKEIPMGVEHARWRDVNPNPQAQDNMMHLLLLEIPE